MRKVVAQKYHLSDSDSKQLEESLQFLHVSELCQVGNKIGLGKISGSKKELIESILAFVGGGQSFSKKVYPPISLADKRKVYPLAPETLMLKNAYKNDLATRLFFKQLIGQHFHFTAYGIDWLDEKWLQGNPPTYKEFAIYWQNAYEASLISKPKPKREWALINFTQQFKKLYPSASREVMMAAWHKKRLEHFKIVQNLLFENKNNLSLD